MVHCRPLSIQWVSQTSSINSSSLTPTLTSLLWLLPIEFRPNQGWFLCCEKTCSFLNSTNCKFAATQQLETRSSDSHWSLSIVQWINMTNPCCWWVTMTLGSQNDLQMKQYEAKLSDNMRKDSNFHNVGPQTKLNFPYFMLISGPTLHLNNL